MTARRRLDRIDIEIMATLQTQGRLTNLKLAELVGLSPSPCLERVKRLETAGYLKRYLAELDIDRLFPNVLVFAEVTLKNHDARDFEAFEAAMRDEPQIIEAYTVGGGFDYLVKFACADIKDYHVLSERLLAAQLGIDKLFSYVVIRQAKAFAGYPLDVLARHAENPLGES